MCGLAGLITLARGVDAAELHTAARHMAQALAHRGPDSDGAWADPEAGIGLSQRRLAIIDLSAEGHQPMASGSGRFIIVFNGEIYNFQSIRRELAEHGCQFRGHSDTEVLLAAVDQWGLEMALPRIAGMFAFALWDRQARVLHLVTDRLGKKPLYFGWVGQEFVFASELKALHQRPGFAPTVDRGALALLLRHGCVPSPRTIYREVFKLPPGRHLPLSFADPAGGRAQDLLASMRTYWSLADVARAGVAAPFAGSEHDAIDALEEVLGVAVRERMIADVPLGALLSGGIDSSIVVALMQKHSSRPVKTFSIGFRETSHDEGSHARGIARHFGTDHTELYVTPDEARAVIPRLPEIYDEPFADRSQIPTFLVAELARREVTVALSGDGGDEVFGGYNRHFLAPLLWRRMQVWPPTLRRYLGAALTAVPPARWDAAARRVHRFLPQAARQPRLGFEIHKVADLLAADSPELLYRRLTSYWADPADVVVDGAELPAALSAAPPSPAMDFAQSMMYCDTISYLPDDILVKVDRASMAVSLEVRAPLLDHRVVEFAWRLPLHWKARGRQGKIILRRLLDRYVPRQMVDRPKQGFDLPIDDWLRGPLRDWAEAMLDPARLAREGFLRPEPIQAVWREHLTGTRDRGWALWPVLMFQMWQERWLTSGAASWRPDEAERLPVAVAGAL
jgi:asparagine synthase (glutamine-hydrolysing)